MLFDKAFLEKTLAEFDAREIEIQQTLDNYALAATTRGKVRVYRDLQRIYAKERAHNAKCRLMLEAWLTEYQLDS